MRNKLLVCLILCLSLVMGLGLSASAESYNVSDAAGLLSYEQLAALDEQSKTVSEYYDCGVYIVIVDDYKSYVPGSIAAFILLAVFGYFIFRKKDFSIIDFFKKKFGKKTI